MNKEEIIDLALRYIEDKEIVDFPEKNDLFCFLNREVPTDKILKDEEGWKFAGYAICTGYEKDYEAKPAGKWIWFNYLSLNTFPPAPEVTKLQPPHIAKGLFSTPDRSTQIRIVKMTINPFTQEEPSTNKSDTDVSQKPKNNILKFPGTKNENQ